MEGLRILFLGENWFGSSARACCYALRRLGCDVADLDCQTIFPQWEALPLRMSARLAHSHLLREYNSRVLAMAEQMVPSILIAFKGHLLLAESLRGRIGAALDQALP